MNTQNKLIALILLTALVGCSEYGSYSECMVGETQKYERKMTGYESTLVDNHCRDEFNWRR